MENDASNSSSRPAHAGSVRTREGRPRPLTVLDLVHDGVIVVLTPQPDHARVRVLLAGLGNGARHVQQDVELELMDDPGALGVALDAMYAELRPRLDPARLP